MNRDTVIPVQDATGRVRYYTLGSEIMHCIAQCQKNRGIEADKVLEAIKESVNEDTTTPLFQHLTNRETKPSLTDSEFLSSFSGLVDVSPVDVEELLQIRNWMHRSILDLDVSDRSMMYIEEAMQRCAEETGVSLSKEEFLDSVARFFDREVPSSKFNHIRNMVLLDKGCRSAALMDPEAMLGTSLDWAGEVRIRSMMQFPLHRMYEPRTLFMVLPEVDQEGKPTARFARYWDALLFFHPTFRDHDIHQVCATYVKWSKLLNDVGYAVICTVRWMSGIPCLRWLAYHQVGQFILACEVARNDPRIKEDAPSIYSREWGNHLELAMPFASCPDAQRGWSDRWAHEIEASTCIVEAKPPAHEVPEFLIGFGYKVLKGRRSRSVYRTGATKASAPMEQRNTKARIRSRSVMEEEKEDEITPVSVHEATVSEPAPEPEPEPEPELFDSAHEQSGVDSSMESDDADNEDVSNEDVSSAIMQAVMGHSDDDEDDSDSSGSDSFVRVPSTKRRRIQSDTLTEREITQRIEASLSCAEHKGKNAKETKAKETEPKKDYEDVPLPSEAETETEESKDKPCIEEVPMPPTPALPGTDALPTPALPGTDALPSSAQLKPYEEQHVTKIVASVPEERANQIRMMALRADLDMLYKMLNKDEELGFDKRAMPSDVLDVLWIRLIPHLQKHYSLRVCAEVPKGESVFVPAHGFGVSSTNTLPTSIGRPILFQAPESISEEDMRYEYVLWILKRLAILAKFPNSSSEIIVVTYSLPDPSTLHVPSGITSAWSHITSQQLFPTAAERQKDKEVRTLVTVSCKFSVNPSGSCIFVNHSADYEEVKRRLADVERRLSMGRRGNDAVFLSSAPRATKKKREEIQARIVDVLRQVSKPDEIVTFNLEIRASMHRDRTGTLRRDFTPVLHSMISPVTIDIKQIAQCV